MNSGILLVGFGSAGLALSAALSGDGEATCESAGKPTANAVFCAAKRWLPSEAAGWHVTGITRVERAAELEAVAPEIPPGDLTPDGFPGPVWVLTASATLRCGSSAPAPASLVYVLEAVDGATLIQSAARCPRRRAFTDTVKAWRGSPARTR